MLAYEPCAGERQDLAEAEAAYALTGSPEDLDRMADAINNLEKAERAAKEATE